MLSVKQYNASSDRPHSWSIEITTTSTKFSASRHFSVDFMKFKFFRGNSGGF